MDLERKEEISQEIISSCNDLSSMLYDMTDRDKARLSAIIHEYLEEAYEAGQHNSPYLTYEARKPFVTSVIEDIDLI